MSATGSSSSIRKSRLSNSGTRQTNGSIDEVSVVEAQYGEFIRFFNIQNQSAWLIIANTIALTIFLLQIATTVFPSTLSTEQYIWESPVFVTIFAVTGIRTLMTFNVPISAQYYVTPILLVVQVAAVILLFVTVRVSRSSRAIFTKRLKYLLYIYSYFSFLFLMPLVYNNAGWTHCEWGLFNDVERSPYLIRTAYDEMPLPCWEFTNSLTGFMGILSFIVVIFQALFASFWIICSIEMDPLRKWNVFSMSSSYLFIFEIIGNSFQVVVEHTVPGTSFQLSWIRFVIYIIWSVILLTYLVRTMPFYKGLVNIAYMSMVVFRLVLSVLAGMSLILLDAVPEISSPLTMLILIASILGLSVIAFLITFVAITLHQRAHMKRVQKQVSVFLEATNPHPNEDQYPERSKRHERETSISDDGNENEDTEVSNAAAEDILDELAKQLNARHLSMAVRFIMGDFSSRESKVNRITDILNMATELQKESCDLLISSSLFHNFVTASPLITYFTLRKAYTFRHHLPSRLTIWCCMGDLVRRYPEETEEQIVGGYLKDLMMRRISIQRTMVSLWESMTDDSVNVKSLASLASLFTKQKSEAQQIWNVLIRTYRKNSNVMRQYGNFIEDIDADVEEAQAYYQEAERLEEYSLAKKRAQYEQEQRKQQQHSNQKRQSCKSRHRKYAHDSPFPGNPHPRQSSLTKLRTVFDIPATKFRVHPIDDTIAPGDDMAKFSEDDNENNNFKNSSNGFDDNMYLKQRTEMELDEFNDVDHNMSKENLFRRSINSQKQRLTEKILFLILMLLFVVSIVTMFLWTNLVNASHSITQYTGESCSMSEVGIDLTRYLRFVQLNNEHAIVPEDDIELQAMLANLIGRAFQKFDGTIHHFVNKYREMLLKHPTWTTPNVKFRYPLAHVNFTDIINAPYSTGNHTRFYQLQTFLGKSQMLANKTFNPDAVKLSEILGPIGYNNISLLSSNEFMTVYLNAFDLDDGLIAQCRERITEYQKRMETSILETGVVASVIIAIRALTIALVLLLLAFALGKRKKKLRLMAISIPKTDIARAYRHIKSRLQEANKLLSASSIEEISRFSKLTSQKRGIDLSFRNGTWIILILLVLTCFEIAFIVLCIFYQMNTSTLHLDKSAVLRNAANVMHISAEDDLTFMEYLLDGSTHMYSAILKQYDVSWDNNHLLLDVLVDRYSELSNALAIMNYGGEFAGRTTYGFVNSKNERVAQLMNIGSCAAGSNDSILTETNGAAPIFMDTCIPSAFSISETLMTITSTSLKTFDSNWNSTAPVAKQSPKHPALKKEILDHFLTTGKLIDSVRDMIVVYLSDDDNQYSQFQIKTVVDAMFGMGVFFTLVMAIVSFFLYNMLLYRDGDIRRLLHWIPVSTLDNVEPLRALVFHYSITSTGKRKKSHHETSKTFSIIQAAADGIVLLTDQFQVMEINRSACELVRMIPAELIGLNFSDFVPSSSQKSFETTMVHLVKKCKTMAGTSVPKKSNAIDGDSDDNDTSTVSTAIVKEMDIIRIKDRTSFPAKLSLNAGYLDGKIVITIFIRDTTNEQKQRALLEVEKKNSEKLLLNVLPRKIAMRLRNGEQNIADRFEDVTCLFSDMEGFTEMSGQLTPGELVEMLNMLVMQFDDHTTALGIEKIKTIGDAFFAVGGLSTRSIKDRLEKSDTTNGDTAHSLMDHPEQVCRLGLAMLQSVENYNTRQRPRNILPLSIRVGVHTGSVMAGVIGKIKYVFDVFGDAVNIASRMESTGVAGKIQVTRQTYQRVFDLFQFKERIIHAKGKGEMVTYILGPKENALSQVQGHSNGNNSSSSNVIKGELSSTTAPDSCTSDSDTVENHELA